MTMQGDKIAVTVYLHDKVLVGLVFIPRGKRLSDLLNGSSPVANTQPSGFIELTDVTIFHGDGIEENAETIYVNKANLQLIATLDGDLARGLGGKDDRGQYPFVQKIRMRASMTLPDYDLDGYLHCKNAQDISGLLENATMFLPLTDASICGENLPSKKSATFCAVNKQHIGSVRHN